jgi:hypothetical protein
MQPPLISRRIVLVLVAVAVLLPIATCVVFGVGMLLKAMNDASGGACLLRVALGGGIAWVIDLICLLLVLGVDRVVGPPQDSEGAE